MAIQIATTAQKLCYRSRLPKIPRARRNPNGRTFSSSHNSSMILSNRSPMSIVPRRSYSSPSSGSIVRHGCDKVPIFAFTLTIDYPPTDQTSTLESCRIALMSRGVSGRSKVVVGQRFSAKWSDIINRSAQLQSCFAFKSPRGGWIKVHSKYSPHPETLDG